jgi:hypothetical protein
MYICGTVDITAGELRYSNNKLQKISGEIAIPRMI